MNTKIFIVLLGTLSAGALMGGPFQNGSFESPVIGGGPDFATVPTGWTKVDPSGVGLFMQLDTTFGIPFVPANGHQSFGFGGNGATTGSLSQTFDTVAGAGYSVDFQYLVQQGLEPEALRVEALDGTTILRTFDIIFINTTWLDSGPIPFTALSTATTLRFSDITGSSLPGFGGSTNWALDAVTVQQTSAPSGVPEPSTLGFLGSSVLAGVVFRRYLRQRRKAS
jgi:hypothetical protein